jgi:DNA-binding transcriptional LysR family regulator
MQIKRLEHALGVALFERTRRQVALTEAGAFLIARARHLLAEAERARLELASIALGESGVISIGYTATASFEVLPRLVPRLRRKRAKVRLSLTEMRSAEQPDALRAGRIEVGFACGPVQASEGVIARVLSRERLMVALPARHALGKRAAVTVRALRDQPFVTVAREVEPAWADPVNRALAGAGVGLSVAQEADTKLAMLGLVAAGVGVSVVSESLARLGRRGVLFRPLRGLALKLPLVVLTRPRPSPRVRLLLSLL